MSMLITIQHVTTTSKISEADCLKMTVNDGWFQAAPQPPPLPPLSPPPLMVPQLTSVQGTSGSSTFGAPVSPEVLTTATDEEEEDEDMPLCHFPREQLRVLEKLGHGEFGEVTAIE